MNFAFPNMMNDIWMFCHSKTSSGKINYWSKVPDRLWLLRLTITGVLK